MLNCGRLAIARGLNIGLRARPWCRARRFASSAANKSSSLKKKLGVVLGLGANVSAGRRPRIMAVRYFRWLSVAPRGKINPAPAGRRKRCW